MEYKILYRHWLVFGMGLAMLEMVVPAFVAFWFGLTEVVVLVVSIRVGAASEIEMQAKKAGKLSVCGLASWFSGVTISWLKPSDSRLRVLK